MLNSVSKFRRITDSYDNPEFWFWGNYGVALRTVRMPEKVITPLREAYGQGRYVGGVSMRGINIENARTCLYLVREKLYAVYLYTYMLRIDILNRTTDGALAQAYSDKRGIENKHGVGFITVDEKNQVVSFKEFPVIEKKFTKIKIQRRVLYNA